MWKDHFIFVGVCAEWEQRVENWLAGNTLHGGRGELTKCQFLGHITYAGSINTETQCLFF